MKKILLIYLFVLLPTVCTAQTGLFKAFGPTNSSCAKYVNEVTTDEQAKQIYSWWVMGFMTGINYVKLRSPATDIEAHDAWLLKYCQEHPLDTFIYAAIKLNEEIERK